MRIDAHQHFWVYDPTQYPWMDDRMQVLKRDHLPEESAPKLKNIGFDGAVAVQARRMVTETEFLFDLAKQHPFIKGVVGWVDFESDELDVQLERYSANPLLKGVRELIHDMTDVNYAISDVHVNAIAKLSRYGLRYDLLLMPPHIRPATNLAQRFPNQPFVLDHIGKPEIAKQMRSPWVEDVQDLAKCNNVCCKLSGMVTEAKWRDWRPADFHTYLDIVVEAFGPQRLMIGSDWPVCTLSADYEQVMTIVIDYVGQLSPDERSAILGGTCARFYGLDTAADDGDA